MDEYLDRAAWLIENHYYSAATDVFKLAELLKEADKNKEKQVDDSLRSV